MTNTNNLPWSFLDAYRGKVFNAEWPTFPQVFRISAERFPDSPCFTDFDGPDASKRSFSYAQVFEKVETLSSWLAANGVKKGDRVAVTGKNSPEWAVAYLAILFAGGISTVNWNILNNNPYHPMDNKAITGEYPPGSTFKIVTGTAALAEHKVTAQEKIFDSGRHWIIPKTNAGGEALGWIDFEQAMAHSDNVYFYEMGNRLGVDTLERYARLFGLGTRTGIDLPYEAEGLVPNRKYKADNYEDGEWYLSETFDAAIGQGFNLVTPLQAAMVVSEIAANGQRYRPHLVQRIVDVNGNTVREIKPELLSTLEVDPSVIHHVQEGLHSVTKLGTGTALFAGFPVDIAGKTGTAENSQGRDHSWFVAYGPYKNPNVVVAVIVEQGGFGSVAAGPIARRILEAAFGLDKQIESTQGKSEGSQ